MSRAETSPSSLLDRLPLGLLTVGRDWRIGLWNARLEAWTGLPAAEAAGRRLEELLPSFAEPHNLSRLELVMEGGPPAVFSWQLHPDLFPFAPPQTRGRAARYTVASCLPEGGILLSVEDRTEIALLLREARVEVGRRREAEKALQAALEAKELVVREANHRIKNNLTMVASLISLEEERASEGPSRRSLADLEARIRSIGLLHELLYSKPSEEEPRLDEYLSRLCESILRSYGGEEALARLRLSLEPHRLRAAAAIKVGLILVELLTNALKYAGREGRPPSLEVELREAGEGRLELLVADDGPGLPETYDAGDSLGFTLMESFAEELGGGLSLRPGPGARFVLDFRGPPLGRG